MQHLAFPSKILVLLIAFIPLNVFCSDEINPSTERVSISWHVSDTCTFGWLPHGNDLDESDCSAMSGWSIDLSEDGDALVVGSPNDSWGQGKVEVFQWAGEAWAQIGASISEPTESTEHFGGSVSISQDGGRIAAASDSFVKVYDWIDGNWIQLGNDIAWDDAGMFWSSQRRICSLSSDGQRIAVGGVPENAVASKLLSTEARVFEWNGVEWIQLGDPFQGSGETGWTGRDVCLSHDGSHISIGADFVNATGQWEGKVYVFLWENEQWNQVGTDISVAPQLSMPSSALALSADASKVAFASGEGVTRVFSIENSELAQVGNDIYPEQPEDGSAFSVSLSYDGSSLAIGSPWSNGYEGSARVFRLEDDAWVQTGSTFLINQDLSNQEMPELGRCVSISGTGDKVALGAPKYNGQNCSGSGSVFVHQLHCLGCTDMEACNYSTNSTADDGSCAFIGDPCDDQDEQTSEDQINEDCECSGISATNLESMNLDHEVVKVFPNPVSTILNIIVQDISLDKRLKIFNSRLQLLYELEFQESTEVDVSGFSRGLHYIELTTGDSVVRQVVVLE